MQFAENFPISQLFIVDKKIYAKNYETQKSVF